MADQTAFEILQSQLGVLAAPIRDYIEAVIKEQTPPVEEEPTPEEPGEETPPEETPDPVDPSVDPEPTDPEEPPVEEPEPEEPTPVVPEMPSTPDTMTTYQIIDYTDGDFEHGINTKLNAVLIRDNNYVQVGHNLRFKNSQGSNITSTEKHQFGMLVKVNAVTLVPASHGAPGAVTLYNKYGKPIDPIVRDPVEETPEPEPEEPTPTDPEPTDPEEPEPENPEQPLAELQVYNLEGNADWVNGVYKTNTMILLPIAEKDLIVQGAVIELADGRRGTVNYVSKNTAGGRQSVKTELTGLDPAVVGYPHTVKVISSPLAAELPEENPEAPTEGEFQIVGVNIAGLGSNPWVVNPQEGTHWRFPSRNYIEAFANKGILTFRNPVAIEKFIVNGQLSQEYIDYLVKYLDILNEFGATCDFEFHNYNRRFELVDEVVGQAPTGINSGDQATRDAARAFWSARGKYKPDQFSYEAHYHRTDNKTRLSEWRIIYPAAKAPAGFFTAEDQANLLRQVVPLFKDHKALWAWGLMNEPFGVTDIMTGNYQMWINAVRESDMEKYLLICGNGYASAEKWGQYSDGLKNLVDPANKIVYEAHTYPDTNPGGGQWANKYEAIPEHAIYEAVKPFRDWCVNNGKKGRIGEVGGPKDNASYIAALDYYLENGAKSWNMQTMLWAGGPGWPSDNATTVQQDVGSGNTSTVPELFANLIPAINKAPVKISSQSIK